MRLGSTALAMGLILTVGPAISSSVTVHSDGVSGDYASIAQALSAVQGESAGPGNADVITILDEGPFREGALVITGDAHSNDLTIRAAEGIRPILVSTHTGANAITIRKNGKATIRDLIIIPAANISQTATRAILYERVASDSTGYDYRLENLLISSNNGNDRAVSGLDGLGNPLFNPNLHASFRGDAGVRGNSTDEDRVYRMTLNDVVVSCIASAAPFGFRSFQDGADGSELIIGEGCVFSHVVSSTANGAAVNIGGVEGSPNIARIQGSEEKPVLIVNNGVHGLYLTGTNTESNQISNTIIVGNGRDGIFLVNPRMSSAMTNVTIANNSGHALRLTQNDGSALNFEGTVHASGVIIAGNGAIVFTNSIYGSLAASGSLVLEDSAIVRFGPRRLTPSLTNGMSISGPGSVVMNGVIHSDPRFATLAAMDSNFARVTAEDYATAGPDDQPLRGGGRYGTDGAGSAFNWYHYN